MVIWSVVWPFCQVKLCAVAVSSPKLVLDTQAVYHHVNGALMLQRSRIFQKRHDGLTPVGVRLRQSLHSIYWHTEALKWHHLKAGYVNQRPVRPWMASFLPFNSEETSISRSSTRAPKTSACLGSAESA